MDNETLTSKGPLTLPATTLRMFDAQGEVTREVALLTEIRDLLKIIAANTERSTDK